MHNHYNVCETCVNNCWHVWFKPWETNFLMFTFFSNFYASIEDMEKEKFKYNMFTFTFEVNESELLNAIEYSDSWIDKVARCLTKNIRVNKCTYWSKSAVLAQNQCWWTILSRYLTMNSRYYVRSSWPRYWLSNRYLRCHFVTRPGQVDGKTYVWARGQRTEVAGVACILKCEERFVLGYVWYVWFCCFMKRYVVIGAVFVKSTVVLVHNFQGCSLHKLLISVLWYCLLYHTSLNSLKSIMLYTFLRSFRNIKNCGRMGCVICR
jgi:hypothetical protein